MKLRVTIATFLIVFGSIYNALALDPGWEPTTAQVVIDNGAGVTYTPQMKWNTDFEKCCHV